MTSLDIVKAAVRAADSKKGRDLRVIKIRDISVLADYFVFVSGDSNTQTRAIAEEVEFKLGEAGGEPQPIEGRPFGWERPGYGSVVVHVFHQGARQVFPV